MWLTGMKKLILYINNFFGSGHFSDPRYLKIYQKMAGTKYFFVSKSQFCHAHQPCKGSFEIYFVFAHFFVRASNCSHYSNFGNKCPKLGTDTPEDMLFTNLGVTTWFPGTRFALVDTTVLLSVCPFFNPPKPDVGQIWTTGPEAAWGHFRGQQPKQVL